MTTKRLEVGDINEDFLTILNQIMKDVDFGRIEMTIISGTIDSIKVIKNFKVTEIVDIRGNKCVKLT